MCTASQEDSSTIFGFNTSSNISVWSFGIRPVLQTIGAWTMGIKISGNDSIVIVNNHTEFYVLKTFTGELLFQGRVNPNNPTTGTQEPQGINGDGSVIATITHSGLLRVYKRTGSTYNFSWQYQEPFTGLGNWFCSVDITNDGKFVSAGTLDFITANDYDGKIRVFNSDNGGSLLWTYNGCGDFVSSLSFSKSGNVLSAVSWGGIDHVKEDLYIFKTFLGGTPIFKLNSPGSLFTTSTSDDGKTVIATGKAVHARQFGNGGFLFNVDVDTSDIITLNNPGTEIVHDYSLYQNYPNPFNPNTKIRFSLPQDSRGETRDVLLIIYNSLGKEISTLVNKKLNAGNFEIEFDGRVLPSGIYFYKLSVNGFSETKKLVLLK